jgi:hypothetical protein
VECAAVAVSACLRLPAMLTLCVECAAVTVSACLRLPAMLTLCVECAAVAVSACLRLPAMLTLCVESACMHALARVFCLGLSLCVVCVDGPVPMFGILCSCPFGLSLCVEWPLCVECVAGSVCVCVCVCACLLCLLRSCHTVRGVRVCSYLGFKLTELNVLCVECVIRVMYGIGRPCHASLPCGAHICELVH